MLATRTFQEHQLSPRTIFYGHKHIMWECAQGFRDELFGSFWPSAYRDVLGKSYLSPSVVKRDMKTAHDSGDGVLIHMDGWHRMVEDYWKRNLTQAKDRVMAFSGVARAYGAEYGLNYLAGAWAEFLPDDLVWHYSSDLDHKRIIPTIIEAANTNVPSWSWLAQPRYKGRSLSFSDRKTLGRRIAHFVRWERPDRTKNHVSDVTFHDFTGLRIWLVMPAVIINPELETSSYVHRYFRCPSLESQLFSAGCASKDRDHASACYYPDSIEHVKKAPEDIVLALMVGDCEKLGYDLSYRFYGLGLQRGGEQDSFAWKRRGYWHAQLQMYKNECKDLLSGIKSLQEEGAKALFLRIPGAEIREFCLV
jgi:hypothetical protein